MNRKSVLWMFLASGVAGMGSGCATKASGQGDETHFLCASDADCAAHGVNFRCEAQRCVLAEASSVPSTGGGAGAPSSGGGSGGPTTNGGAGVGAVGGNGGSAGSGGQLYDIEGGVQCQGGTGGMPSFPRGDNFCNSPGGAIGYATCPNFFDSGLRTISCPDGGPGGRPPLVDLCDHMGEVAQLFEQRIVFNCVQGTLGLAKSLFFRRDGAAGFGGSATFDVPKLCDAQVTEALRQCTTSFEVCPRPPMCTAEGTFGCDDIVGACPALSSKECRNGFDTRDYAGRERIRECLVADGGDCVVGFYRCAWGL